MHLSIKILSVFLLMLSCTLVLFSGCTGYSSDNYISGENESLISVAVSIPPQKEFVEAVGGEKVNVFVMLSPGSNPHSSELTSGELKEVSKASMYAMTGSGIESELAWMDKIRNLNPDMLVTDCSKNIIPIKDGDGEGYGDPHIWLSLKNAKIMSENIFEGLVSLSPEDEDYFRKNLDTYEKRLDILDKKIEGELAGREGEIIMVYHPAWSYFARDYSLRQLPIEDEGKEPAPLDLAELIDQAEENNIKIVFASPEYSTKSANVIAKAIGGRVVLIDPLSENYISNMEYVAQAFAEE